MEYREFMEIYHTKCFDSETSDFLLKLEPLRGVIADEETMDEKEKTIVEATVSHSVIQYLNKGYRFFIAGGDDIVYQDNDLIPRDMKTLKTSRAYEYIYVILGLGCIDCL